MAGKKSPKPAAKKAAINKHDKLLAAHTRHTEMANKHRAHADLIDAKLRVEGKRVKRAYDPGEKPKIVDDHGY